MPDPVVLNKANPFANKAEDYNLLRREGIQHIEKLSGDIWTDYNTHDPGITLLEALCYAITDLAYRTGSPMKDLLAPEHVTADSWKNIFYTSRQILPCNPVTLNDYRKLLIDINGVRNAWITISEDCEVPVYVDYSKFKPSLDAWKAAEYTKEKLVAPPDPLLPLCEGSHAVNGPLTFDPAGKIIELNGLYKIIIEYEKDIAETNDKNDNKRETKLDARTEVKKEVLKRLHCHRSLCEDFLSVTAAEYRDFTLKAEILLKDTADPEMVLAETCFRIQNYFTPGQKFYTLEELLEKKYYAEDIFEGPFLNHGFILDEELEKTDFFRDMRLSDIINSVADINGIIALKKFKVNDNLFPDDPNVDTDEGPFDTDDPCGPENFFDEWIAGMKRAKLIGRLNTEDLAEHVNDEDIPAAENNGTEYIAPLKIYKSGKIVRINTARFQKLLKDLETLDRNNKLNGHSKDFEVPYGDNMALQDFYPVQYSLPKTYQVGEDGLPMKEGNTRLVQALQLKGYLAVFEQLFLNFLAQLNSLNTLFSFNETDVTSFIKKIVNPDPDYPDDATKYTEEIKGYLYLYADSKKYIADIQRVTEDSVGFQQRRNRMLDHLLARFSEEMNEYGTLMKYIYPKNWVPKIIKNKTDLLADYVAASKNRGKGYNYKLEDECWNSEGNADEEKISRNVTGTERRISRLLGFADFRRKEIAPCNLLFIVSEDGKKGKIKLYDDCDQKTLLLESKEIKADCEDEIMHCIIEGGCCGDNFINIPESKKHTRRKPNSKNSYGFILVDCKDEERIIAESPVLYPTEQLRDEARKKAVEALNRICHTEGMHMIEHILLRPKGDDLIEKKDANGNTIGEPTAFQLLDICLDDCDVARTVKPGENPKYRFDISVLPSEDCIDGRRWLVELKKIAGPNTIFKKTFKEYEQASEFISRLREYGSELKNFNAFENEVVAGNFFFNLYNEDKRLIIESNLCYTGPGTNPITKKRKAEQGKKKDLCSEIVAGDAWDEIKELKKFLAFELDLYCCEDPCDHNEDPYSFRVSFVLPCWSKRFRDKGFRNLVEKTIRSETPAHVHAKIYWLGIEQMRNFETAWSEWLIEMACNDVPDINITNDFILQVKNLKNCDQPCNKEDNHNG